LQRTFDRDSAEFGRVLAFSDGLFAIAMTLLIVAVGVPHLNDEASVHQLADALHDLLPAFTSFFISFAVIGRYWLAHHRFIALLGAMNQRFIVLNLVYLAFIAFLPFPTGLLGEYFSNPLSVVIYAVNVALVSGMEVVLLRNAYRDRLLVTQPSPEVYRYGVAMSLSPLIFFAISIPVAFFSTTLAVCTWFLSILFGTFAKRWEPEGAEELMLG
jgi:uncharacterized membrane protein